MGRPASSLPRITFRLSEDLENRLMASAVEANRSLNAEIVARLEASYGNSEAPFTPEQEKVVMAWLDASMAEIKTETERRLREVEEKAGLR